MEENTDIKNQMKTILETANEKLTVNLCVSRNKTEYISALTEILKTEDKDYLFTDTTDFCTSLISSIINNRYREFRRQFCEVELLVIVADWDYLMKNSIQIELAHILDVRLKNSLPIIIMSPTPLREQKLISNDLKDFILAGECIEI